MRRLLLGIILLTHLVGCGDSLSLSVDLRTDLVPGAEFVVVTATIVGERDPVTTPTVGDFFQGVRVLNLDGLDANASRTVIVRLFDQNGQSVAERTMLVEQRENRVLTITISRDCRSTRCPTATASAATACLGGQCVDPTCIDGTEASCPDAECEQDSECPMLNACAVPRCRATVCVYEASPGGCGSGLYCSPEEGCRPVPEIIGDAGVDMGVQDSGPDGGMGAGVLTPHLTWPVNGAAMNQGTRARFSWTGVEGATLYEVEGDDSCDVDQRVPCAFSSPEFTTSGPARFASAVLPSGSAIPRGTRYRWRVRACSGASCGLWSETRYLDIGRGVSDFDGDGVDELTVGARDQLFHLAFADGRFVQRTLATPFMDATSGFGRRSYYADFNADGFADVAISAPFDRGFGAIALYYGSRAGLGPAEILTQPMASELNGFFSEYACGGDFDGDGFPDLAVTSAQGTFFYRGGASGLSLVPETRRDDRLHGCADVNQDGFMDAIFGGAYYGGQAAGLVGASLIGLPTGQIREAVGDTNQDGFGDFVGFGPGGTAVFYGNAGSVEEGVPVGGFEGSPFSFDYQSLGAADLNRDGYSDAVMGDIQSDNRFPGLVALSMGGPSGLSPRVELVLPCERDCRRRGNAISYGMDLNGDGFGDAVVAAFGEEAVFVFFGNTTGLDAPIRVAAETATEDFGVSL